MLEQPKTWRIVGTLSALLWLTACGAVKSPPPGDAGVSATPDSSRLESCWPPGVGRCRDQASEVCGRTGWWEGAKGSCSVAPTVAAGDSHTCALQKDGRVRCWGINFTGELGLGDANVRGDDPNEMGDLLLPVELGTGRHAVALAAAWSQTCAILDDRRVKCWGETMQWGDDTVRGDEPGEMGDQLPAVELGLDHIPIAVAVGSGHACVLLDNHQVKCWGANGVGQLGLGTPASASAFVGNLPDVDLGTGSSAVSIALGSSHSCALLNDGRVKCWGHGELDGRLGLGDMENRGDNPDEMGDRLPAVDLGSGRKAIAIGAGAAHTCALLDNREVKCWGANLAGQLGLGDRAPRGGQPDEMGDKLPAVTTLGEGTASLALGGDHTCVVLDGALRCWGENAEGELGVGDVYARGAEKGDVAILAPIDLGSGRSVVGATVGYRHVCALLDDAKVKCWGTNTSGELGLGDQRSRGAQPGQMGDELPAVDLGR